MSALVVGTYSPEHREGIAFSYKLSREGLYVKTSDALLNDAELSAQPPAAADG